MNLKPIVILAIAASACGFCQAQSNSPQAVGYLQRAAAMLSDGNFQGCLDQCKVALEQDSQNREAPMWLSAVASFRAGYPEAEARLQSFIRQFPGSANVPQARFMLASLKFFAADYAGALKAFNAIKPSSLNTDDAESLNYRTAFCYLKMGNNDAASRLFTSLTKSQQYGAAATFYLAYIAYSDEDYSSALSLFRKCDRAVAPGDMADYYVAQIYFKQSRFADAINLMQPMLARQDMPEEFRLEADRVVGECLYLLGDDNRAMVYLNDYVKACPESIPLSTRYIVGMERYQTGMYEDAIDMLAPVAELSDRMGQSAALTIGQSYMALGNTKLAIMAFNKAARLGIDPQITEMAYYNYAVAQVDGGRVPFGNSIKTLEDFIRLYPDSRYANQVREYLVKGYMASDDYEDAMRALNAYTGPATTDILDARQRVNFMLGSRQTDPDKAIAYFTEAQKYDSRSADIARQTRLWLGDAYYTKGNYASAQKQYQSFLAMAPSGDVNRPVAQYNLAYSFFGQRKYDEARTQFRAAEGSRALAAEARMDCLNRVADTYYYQGDFASAEKTYADAAALSPLSADYSLFQMALMQGYLKQRDKKLETIDRLILNYPSSPLIPDAMVEKAMTSLMLAQVDDAMTIYKQVADAYPATAQGRNALLQLAILNSEKGDKQQATEYYRLVVSRHPTSSEAQIAVQNLKQIYADDGGIEELNSFLEQIEGAPQLDAVERNAIAAASLLHTARTAASADTKLKAALTMLQQYPDAEGAEEALKIAADIEFSRGLADDALAHYTRLEQSASTPAMRHAARMGIIRSARDMGNFDLVLSVSDQILSGSTGSGSDVPEVKFIRAYAFAGKDDVDSATTLWLELAATPANLYGTRASFEMADAQFRAGNLAGAASSAEKLIDANPPHAYWLARTFILYSDILRAQGSDYEANEYLRALKSNYPGTENDIFIMIDSRLPKE